MILEAGEYLEVGGQPGKHSKTPSQKKKFFFLKNLNTRYAFNLTIQEVESGRFMSLRPVWSNSKL